MNDLLAVGLAVVLLALNAFFVGAEFALISARRSQIEPRAQAGSRMARTTLRAMENVSLMMAGAQLGITICSLGLGAVGEPAVAHLLEPVFESLHVPHDLVHPISFVIALAVVVFLHVVLGEMVPKNIAIAGPDRAAVVLGPPMLGQGQRGVGLGHHLAGMFQHRGAEVGQGQPPGGAAHQALAQAFFQRREPARQGGFGPAQLGGREREAAALRHPGEEQQVGGVQPGAIGHGPIVPSVEQRNPSNPIYQVGSAQYSEAIDTPTSPRHPMKLLQINGSARRVEQGALSTLLANELSAALLAARPGSRATVRDLAAQPHPALDEAALGALFTPPERSEEHTSELQSH